MTRREKFCGEIEQVVPWARLDALIEPAYKFRHLLEEQKLTASLFKGNNAHLAECGRLLREGTMVDATIIAAPPSTKNAEHAGDSEMYQTRKGKEWNFGMKAHIGADANSGLVHRVHVAAASERDVAHSHEALHGQRALVSLGAGYDEVIKREEIRVAQLVGKIRGDIEWHVVERRGR